MEQNTLAREFAAMRERSIPLPTFAYSFWWYKGSAQKCGDVHTKIMTSRRNASLSIVHFTAVHASTGWAAPAPRR